MNEPVNGRYVEFSGQKAGLGPGVVGISFSMGTRARDALWDKAAKHTVWTRVFPGDMRLRRCRRSREGAGRIRRMSPYTVRVPGAGGGEVLCGAAPEHRMSERSAMHIHMQAGGLPPANCKQNTGLRRNKACNI